MATPYTADRKKRRDELFANPDTLETICAHVASGGTLIELSDLWDLPFGWISNWLHTDKDRDKRYRDALNDRAEWCSEIVLRELRRLGLVDIKKIFNEDHTLKPVTDWPDEIAHAVAGLEVNELFDGVGKDRIQVGVTKKVKLADKNRALELLGKNLQLFVDRVEHSGRVTLEDLVVGSNKDEDKK